MRIGREHNTALAAIHHFLNDHAHCIAPGRVRRPALGAGLIQRQRFLLRAGKTLRYGVLQPRCRHVQKRIQLTGKRGVLGVLVDTRGADTIKPGRQLPGHPLLKGGVRLSDGGEDWIPIRPQAQELRNRNALLSQSCQIVGFASELLTPAGVQRHSNMPCGGSGSGIGMRCRHGICGLCFVRMGES